MNQETLILREMFRHIHVINDLNRSLYKVREPAPKPVTTYYYKPDPYFLSLLKMIDDIRDLYNQDKLT